MPLHPQGSLFFLIVQAMFGSVMGTLVGGVCIQTELIMQYSLISVSFE